MFCSPLNPLVVSSRYGPRPIVMADGVTPGPMHPGVDLRAAYREVVRSLDAGIVLRSYLSQCFRRVHVDGAPAQLVPYPWRPGDPTPDALGYGETVVIVHADGTQARYAHLDARLVLDGEHVAQGQPIGFAGTTGYSFGVHLHLEVRAPGGRAYLDPLPLLAHLHPAVL